MDRKKKNLIVAILSIAAYLIINAVIAVSALVFLPPLALRLQGDAYFSAGELSEAEEIYGELGDESRLLAVAGMRKILNGEFYPEAPVEGVALLREGGFTVEFVYETADGSIVGSSKRSLRDVYGPLDGREFLPDNEPTVKREGYLHVDWKIASARLSGKRRLIIKMEPEFDLVIFKISYAGVDPMFNPNPREYTVTGGRITLAAPTGSQASGFIGWYSDTALTHEVKYIEGSEAKNLALYAKYEGGYTPVYSASDITNFRSGRYILMNDISWRGSPEVFSGILNGNGHTVTMKDPTYGMFYINEGAVFDLSLRVSRGDMPSDQPFGSVASYNFGAVVNCDVECFAGMTADAAGAITGSNAGVITDCRASGRISSNANHVGGIAGYNRGRIERCSSEVTLTVDYKKDKLHNYPSKVGGFVGANAGYIYDCYSAADVTGDYSITGGFVGLNSGEIGRCYFVGSVSNKSAGGACSGFVGEHFSYFLSLECAVGSISDCFAVTEPTDGQIATFYGAEIPYYFATIANCYRPDSSGALNNAGGSKTAEELRTAEFQKKTLGFDEELWTLTDGSYPTLK